MAQAAAVEQLEGEAGGIAQFTHGGWRRGDDQRVLIAAETRIDPRRQRRDTVLRSMPRIPVAQRDKDQAGILPAPAKAEAIDREDIIDRSTLLLAQITAQFIQRALGAVGGCSRGGGHLREGNALILIGQEAAGHAQEGIAQGAEQRDIDQHHPRRPSDAGAHAPNIAARQPVEAAVEPAEEAARALARLMRPQHGGAEHRGEDDGDQHRQGHGRGDGHRELPIDHPHRPAKEGHRQEHSREHQGNADQRAGDLVHGFARGLQRREVVLGHHALDILDHHDGVIHQQADGQHQAKQGQGVDTEA